MPVSQSVDERHLTPKRKCLQWVEYGSWNSFPGLPRGISRVSRRLSLRFRREWNPLLGLSRLASNAGSLSFSYSLFVGLRPEPKLLQGFLLCLCSLDSAVLKGGIFE